MDYVHPEIDLAGLIHDLSLNNPAARILGSTAHRIRDPGLRALLIAAILGSEPRRYALLPGPVESGYARPGGWALRAAVMVRAADLLTRTLRSRDRDEAVAAALIGNLGRGAVKPDNAPGLVASTLWLQALARSDRAHLLRWGCDAPTVHRIAALAALAGGSARHALQRSAGRAVETTIVLACRAAEVAIPPTGEQGPCLPPLPAWLDPDLDRASAEIQLWEALSTEEPEVMSHAQVISPLLALSVGRVPSARGE